VGALPGACAELSSEEKIGLGGRVAGAWRKREGKSRDLVGGWWPVVTKRFSGCDVCMRLPRWCE